MTAAMSQLNAVLMLQCRSKNAQIQLVEAALRSAHIRVPCLRLARRSSDGGSPDGGSSSSSSRDAAVNAAVAASEAAAAAAAVATPDAASAAEPTEELLKVRINVTCVTQPGDQLYLAGDHPVLGGWQPHAGSALPMQPAGRNVWQAELELPAAAAAAVAAAPAAQRDGDGLMMLCFKVRRRGTSSAGSAPAFDRLQQIGAGGVMVPALVADELCRVLLHPCCVTGPAQARQRHAAVAARWQPQAAAGTGAAPPPAALRR